MDNTKDRDEVIIRGNWQGVSSREVGLKSNTLARSDLKITKGCKSAKALAVGTTTSPEKGKLTAG